MANNNKNKSLAELKEELEQAKKAYELVQQFYEKKEQEEAEKHKAKLVAEKEARKAEVDACIAHCKELVKAYINDYGDYSFISNEDAFRFNSRFWNWIW